MTAKNSLRQDMPYERFIALGPEALSDAELIAIILRTGTRSFSALELAKRILRKTNGSDKGLNCLHHLSLQELKEIPGIGEVKAVKLKCMAEIAVRMSREKASGKLKFDSPRSVAEYYMEEMRHQEKEKILLLLLDNKLHFIEEYMISLGTVNSSLLSTRDVFIRALKVRASHIMLLHNHPSGDPKPSRQDILITRKIKEAGELMDIPLVDHIILGDGIYTSLKEEELL